MAYKNHPSQGARKSIRIWLGDGAKDYDEIQRNFLEISLYDYCHYLETLSRTQHAQSMYKEILFSNGRVQNLYQEIRQNTGADGDTDMNHVLNLLHNITTNSFDDDDDLEAQMYDWAIQAIYDLLITPWIYQATSKKTDVKMICQKIAESEKEHQEREKNEQ